MYVLQHEKSELDMFLFYGKMQARIRWLEF